MSLLTIVVPTYNRAGNLALLLRTLQAELAGLESEVTVLVSDNASIDDTPRLIGEIQADWPALQAQRHPVNLGADGNCCACVERVATRYFWIIGDDDLPKRGVVPQLVALLRNSAPSLVYMQSEWVNPVTGPDQGDPVGELQVEMMDSDAFARRVHIWFTFLSSVVIDHAMLMRKLGEHSIRRFTGTYLVQLGWILPLLRSDGHFAFINDRCLLATKDNTGGYPLLTVFGVRFAQVVNAALGRGSRTARLLVSGNVLHYMPGLLWGARGAKGGRHDAEDAWPDMRAELGHRPLFWLLLVPVGRFPGWLAQPFYQAWRVFHRLNREMQKLRSRFAAGGAASQ